jgi:hypothetical protein
MEQRVSVITLGIGDLAASQAFYERLGWRCAMRDRGGCFLNPESSSCPCCPVRLWQEKPTTEKLRLL